MGGDVPAEAFEVFVAEAARLRLADRVGAARITLSSGQVVQGSLTRDVVIEDHLVIRSGHRIVVTPAAAIVLVVGTSPVLRDESDHRPGLTLPSWLRGCWHRAAALRVCVRDLGWVDVRLDLVGADHVDVHARGERWVLPIRSVDAWSVDG